MQRHPEAVSRAADVLSRKRKRSRAVLPSRVYIGGIPKDVLVEDVVARFSRPPALKVTPVVDAATGHFQGRAYLDVAPIGEDGVDPVAKLTKVFHGTLWRGSRLRVEPAEADYLARLKAEKEVAGEEEAAGAKAKVEAFLAWRGVVEAKVAKRVAKDLAGESATAAAAAAATAGGAGGSGSGSGAAAPMLPMRIRHRKGERALKVRGDPVASTEEAEAAAAAKLQALPEAKRAKQRSHALRPRSQRIDLEASNTSSSSSSAGPPPWLTDRALEPIPLPSHGMLVSQSRAQTMAEVAAAMEEEEEEEKGGEDGDSDDEDGSSEEEEEEEEEELAEEEGEAAEPWSAEDFSAAAASLEVCGQPSGGTVTAAAAAAPEAEAEPNAATTTTASGKGSGGGKAKSASNRALRREGMARGAGTVTISTSWRELLYGKEVAEAGRSQLPLHPQQKGGGKGSVGQPGVTHFFLTGKGGKGGKGAAAGAGAGAGAGGAGKAGTSAPAPSSSSTITPLAPFQGIVAPHKDTAFKVSSLFTEELPPPPPPSAPTAAFFEAISKATAPVSWGESKKEGKKAKGGGGGGGGAAADAAAAAGDAPAPNKKSAPQQQQQQHHQGGGGKAHHHPPQPAPSATEILQRTALFFKAKPATNPGSANSSNFALKAVKKSLKGGR